MSKWALCMLGIASGTVILATFVDIGWLWLTSCALFLSCVHPWDKGKCMLSVPMQGIMEIGNYETSPMPDCKPSKSPLEVIKCSECLLCMPDPHCEAIGRCHNESPYIGKRENAAWPIVNLTDFHDYADGCAEGIRKTPEMIRYKWPFDKQDGKA